jgi:cytochrome P450
MSRSIEEQARRLLGADPALLADPFPVWNALRDQHPVWRVGDTVVLTRHRDVKELLGDNRVFYSRAETKVCPAYVRAKASFSPHGRDAFGRVLDHEFHQLVRMDPPDHPRTRRVVAPPFSARRLAQEMEQRIQTRVTANVARIADEGGVIDFKRFAYTFPLEVLGDLLGIPLDDLDQVHAWAAKIAENKFNADSEQDAIEADAAYEGLMGYIDMLVARQRASGNSTGLVSALMSAEDSGTVSHAEATAMIALMIFAGHETTSNLLAIGTLELLRRPEQWADLCADPGLIPAAIEELLRFVSPVQFLQYTATESRDLGGGQVKSGDTVIGVLAAANRDPEVFTEPDALQIRRTDSRNHLGFGLGPHFCLGAGLARMEATSMFRELTRRLPHIELADDDLAWGGRALRTPLEMPIRCHTRASI